MNKNDKKGGEEESETCDYMPERGKDNESCSVIKNSRHCSLAYCDALAESVRRVVAALRVSGGVGGGLSLVNGGFAREAIELCEVRGKKTKDILAREVYCLIYAHT